MFCAELMSNMKDVPSTERMVMCSQRWKLLKQGEKDSYQKRCEQVSSVGTDEGKSRRSFKNSNMLRRCVFSQRKKEYEIEMNRFLSVSEPRTVTRPMCTLNILLKAFFQWPVLPVWLCSRCPRKSSSGCYQRRRLALREAAAPAVLHPRRKAQRQRSGLLSAQTHAFWFFFVFVFFFLRDI